MSVFFYRLAGALSKWTGDWLLGLFAGTIAAGFFFLFPGRTRESARFYGALFPGKRLLLRYLDAWKQYQRFTHVYMDRLRLFANPQAFAVRVEGWETLKQLLDRNEGAILLMSHLGNWNAAAHLLRREKPTVQLMLYMGARDGERLEKLQKEGLADDGIKVIAVDQGGASPFQLIEANTFMQQGGLVSLTGDRIWHDSQRTVTVTFLGHEIRLPESPHMLALISGKSLFVMFPVKTGRRKYHIRICPPIYVRAVTRPERKTAVLASAQAYADRLAAEVRRHPHEWFHFEPFLGKKL